MPDRFPLRRVQYYEEYADEIGIDRVVDPADYYKVLPLDEITLEELVEWHSREATDVNCYRQAGTAERLAELITKHSDKKTAYAVLLDIAEIYGGVHRI